MKIGLLPQGGKDWIAGVIYLQNLVRALNLLPEAEKPTLYFVLGPGHTIQHYQDLNDCLPSPKRFTYRSGDSLRNKIAAIRHREISHWPRSLEKLVQSSKLSALFPLQESLGSKFPVPWVGWIPDFQHKCMPEFFSDDELQSRDQRFQNIVRDAEHIVVSSRDAYGDLMRWFPTRKERTSIFPFVSVAAEEWYRHDPDRIRQQFRLPTKYLMFPSQFWIHKNHSCLFEALRLVKSTSCPEIALVCTGNMNDYRHPGYGEKLLRYLRDQGLEGNVYCLGLLERHTQIQLLRGAAAVIQPSFFEGWSALVEDARTFGKKIFVSDIPVHREQNPPDAIFFNPKSPEELAGVIAAEWDSLSSGPDRRKEKEAYALQKERAVEFARSFLTVLGKVGCR